jgi:hypothetical protein
MTAKANHTFKPTTACSAPLVLFGVDSHGKPKAARFGKQHAGLAIRAATQLQLQVLASNDPKIAELAARLPVGRIHATGRTFVPFIRRDLYDELIAATANGSACSASHSGGSSGASGSLPGGSAPPLPQNWQEIGVGHLVVAHDDPTEGWYEAIVTATDGDMLTLRWRDYPRERRIVRHRNRIALLYPKAKPMPETGTPAKTTAVKQQGKAAAANPVTSAHTLPNDWREIDIGQLVLAKDDGPWRSWWEATPVEKEGDVLKLRWRDFADVPLITRPRLDLALICPDAA